MLIFLKILLIFFCIFIGLILVILFTPIFLSFSSNEKKTEDTSVMIYFFHPAFIRISYIISGNKYVIVILNIITFGTPKEKSEPDLTEKTAGPDKEQSTSEPVISHTEHNFEEYMSENSESGNSGNRQSDLDIEDKEQEDIDINKDIKSSGYKALSSEFYKNLKKKFLALKDLSLFVLDQKKIAKKVIIWLKRIIIRVVRVVSFDNFSLYLRAGFDDPFLTGIVYGYFIGIKKVIGSNKRSSDGFLFEPVFHKNDSVTIDGSIRIKTSLARMCRPLFIAILTFPYFSAFFLWLRIKKRKKAISE